MQLLTPIEGRKRTLHIAVLYQVFVLKLVGGAVYYKTCYQPTVVISSTEAEFAAVTKVGKAILYIRTILEESGIPQINATTLYINNNGAINMANNQQHTIHTRHIELKHFIIYD